MVLTSKSGVVRDCKPRLVGSIIKEMLHSDSLLATGYRKFHATRVNAEKGGLA